MWYTFSPCNDDPQYRGKLAMQLRNNYRGKQPRMFFAAVAHLMIRSIEGRIVGNYGTFTWEQDSTGTAIRYKIEC